MLKQCFKALVSARLPANLLTMTRRNPVCVLTYHRIVSGAGVFDDLHVDAFRSQMRWIKRRCRVLHPQEMEDALSRGGFKKPPVLVTFDDGYRDFHDVAFPILQELNLPALVFVATDFIGTGRLLWTDTVDAALQLSAKPSVRFAPLSARPLPLTDPHERRRIAGLIKGHLKELQDRERREHVSALLGQLDVADLEARLPRQMLSWDEVRSTMPLATFGGHSHRHPILSSLSADEQARDLATATEILHTQIGAAPRFFAYPNGRREDFTQQTQAILRSLGYQMAFTTISGLNGPASDRFALNRQYTRISAGSDLAWQVMGGATLLNRASA